MSKRRKKKNRGNGGGGTSTASAPRFTRAAYKNARPTSDTLRQFLSARRETALQALPPQTRESLLTQARAESVDNQHAGGIARLFGLYVIGTGPRLKFKGFPKHLRRDVPRELLDYVNFRWERYADAIDLGALLRQAMRSLVVDGEAFLFVAPNPKIREGFNLKLLDSLRVGNPDSRLSTPTLQDGVYLDAYGNVEAYCVYRVPEALTSFYRSNEYDIIGASQIFHLFRPDFPGQTRGASWFQAALPLLQQLREYTAAVIESAKRSAKLVLSFETQQGFPLELFNEYFAQPTDAPIEEPADPSYGYVPWDSWGTFHTQNGDSLVLPPGTTQKSIDPAQPTTEASAFTSNILGQIGYSLGLPRNKATGSSHEYNFASGRLDNQPFEMLIKTLQIDLFERRALDKLFNYFYESIAPDVYSEFDDAPEVDAIEWEWVWPEPPLIDPESQARTNSIKLQSLQTTLSECWNQTHPFSEFADEREEILRDAKDFPNVFGLKDAAAPVQENTDIAEPKAPPIDDKGERDGDL